MEHGANETEPVSAPAAVELPPSAAERKILDEIAARGIVEGDKVEVRKKGERGELLIVIGTYKGSARLDKIHLEYTQEFRPIWSKKPVWQLDIVTPHGHELHYEFGVLTGIRKKA